MAAAEEQASSPVVVVAATGTTTRFICAHWTQDPTTTPAGVFHSNDGGQTWTATGIGFPSDAGRIALGVRADDPNTVYALVAAHGTGTLQGLYRLDTVAVNWKTVGALPDVLPVQNGQSQGDYDLAIAVDPTDLNTVYLGGSYADVDPYPASIWRCEISIQAPTTLLRGPPRSVTHAHADVHSLVHTPGDSDELWCTCDGGVFLNRAPRSNGEFA